MSIFAPKGCSNAHGELSAAVPLVPLRQKLCFSPPLFIPEQDGEGAAQEPDGTQETWHDGSSQSQERMGVEPVLCSRGIHGI